MTVHEGAELVVAEPVVVVFVVVFVVVVVVVIVAVRVVIPKALIDDKVRNLGFAHNTFE